MSAQPNIVVLVSHDTGRHIGPYGISTVHNPHAERLAREGVLFTNAFATSPGCCPSRSGLFSGRAPHSVGMYGQTGHWAGFRFSDQATHASQHFKNLGYETMLLGLAHEIAGAGCPDSYFDGIGFDHVSERHQQFCRTLKEDLTAMLDRRQQEDKPLYLQIGTDETHTAYLRDGVETYDKDGVTIPDSPYLADGPGTRQQFADLQGSVNRLDEGLGQCLELLEERDMLDNTLFVYTTDHGLPMPREKTTLYDRGIGVFLIIRYPGVFEPGTTCDDLVSNIDLVPTLIEAAGGEVPDEIEGQSFYRGLTGGDYTPREHLFAEKTFHTSYDPIRCLRTKQYKYIFNFESVRPENYCLDIAYKPVLLETINELPRRPFRFDELYDLEADPHETTNLAEEAEYQELRHQFATELVKWMRETDDALLDGPVPTPQYHERIDWLNQHVGD